MNLKTLNDILSHIKDAENVEVIPEVYSSNSVEHVYYCKNKTSQLLYILDELYYEVAVGLREDGYRIYEVTPTGEFIEFYIDD